MPSTDREVATTRTYVVTTSHNAAGEVLHRRSRRLVNGEDLHVDTVARESAEARQWRAHLDQLIEDLEPVIGRDQYITLDTAVVNMEVAIRREYLARLVRAGVEAMDAYTPGLLVLSPTALASVPQPTHDPDTCRCCSARLRWCGRRVRLVLTAAFALGAAGGALLGGRRTGLSRC